MLVAFDDVVHSERKEKTINHPLNMVPKMWFIPLLKHGFWGLTGLPSGKHTKNYGKSQFSMGKSTINHHFQ
jgi:hypothetical protein